MQDIERVQARLSNIRTVRPILEALRTISIGGWQMALKQQSWLGEYSARLQAIFPALAPHLDSSARRRPLPAPAAAQRLAVLVIGSERGLCGKFNIGLAQAADDYVQARLQDGLQVSLWALGSRLVRLIRRRAWDLEWSGSLSVTSMPSFQTAWKLSQRWLTEYEALRLDAADILYNAYRRPGVYVATTIRLLPPELPPLAHEELWPPPIVETDPQRIYARVVEQWTALNLYRILLDSAASEHSARFQLMESATQNADRLIFELTQLVQSARKHAITREMQELAVGAGLIGPRTPG